MGRSQMMKDFERLVVEAEAQECTDVMVARWKARAVLEYIEELEALVREVPFKVGDVVRAVGDEEPTGEIILIKKTDHDTGYVVRLFRPNGFAGTITFYEGEIELIGRGDD